MKKSEKMRNERERWNMKREMRKMGVLCDVVSGFED